MTIKLVLAATVAASVLPFHHEQALSLGGAWVVSSDGLDFTARLEGGSDCSCSAPVSTANGVATGLRDAAAVSPNAVDCGGTTATTNLTTVAVEGTSITGYDVSIGSCVEFFTPTELTRFANAIDHAG